MRHIAIIARLGSEAPDIRPGSGSVRARFEAAMGTAFGADPAACRVGSGSPQLLNVFRPLVVLLGVWIGVE